MLETLVLTYLDGMVILRIYEFLIVMSAAFLFYWFFANAILTKLFTNCFVICTVNFSDNWTVD